MLHHDSISLTSLKLTMVRVNLDTQVTWAIGTGFLWKCDARCLVTNLHNVTGWDFEKKRALSETGACPTHILANVRHYISQEGGGRGSLSVPATIRLHDDEGQPLWWVHPALKNEVDIAMLPLRSNMQAPTFNGTWANICINESDFVDFRPSAGDDCFVIGFPRGINAGLGLPVWKRASIASEPEIDVDRRPVVLVDTATREGMSGSPAIYVRRGYTVPTGGSMADAVLGESSNFLGVYSGRVGSDELGVQLGRVWKAQLVRDIASGKVRGSMPW